MTATGGDGLQLDLTVMVKCADAFRAVDFGGVDGEEVDAEAGDGDVEKTKSLGGVGVKDEGEGGGAG